MANRPSRGGAVKIRYIRSWTLKGPRWRAQIYCPENGEILAWTEGYSRRISAVHAIDRMRRQLPIADEEFETEIQL